MKLSQRISRKREEKKIESFHSQLYQQLDIIEKVTGQFAVESFVRSNPTAEANQAAPSLWILQCWDSIEDPENESVSPSLSFINAISPPGHWQVEFRSFQATMNTLSPLCGLGKSDYHKIQHILGTKIR